MSYYVMVGEGVYPVARIEDIHDEDLEDDLWMHGGIVTCEVPEPILYDLDPRFPGNPKVLYDAPSIPIMHVSLLDALIACGVDNLDTYDAVLRDLDKGIEYKDYKAFNVIGLVAAADMNKSTMMGTSDSMLIDADFDRLVIDESKCHGLLMFRLAENVSAIVVHERIKKEVEKRGIKGVFFYANGEWAG